jgi:hypothetical protein
LDELPIPVHVVTTKVAEEASALADHHQQAPAGVVVLPVLAKVLGQLVDARRQQSDLDGRRAGVALVPRELADDFCLGFLGQRHDERKLAQPHDPGRRCDQAPKGTPGLRGDLSCAVDVSMHLVHERVGGREALLVPEPLEKGQPQRTAVEVTFEVD